MATSSWSSGNAHTTDADFRAWGSELSTKLQSMSLLTKTTDTGQVNWATVTRPAVNTDGGYEVYYLNDSLHASAPIYFKLYYGTADTAVRPRIRIEVGTGSNGSGTLTGTGSGVISTCTRGGSDGSSTAQPSYLCVAQGFVGLCWKTATPAFFSITRTCDSSGTLSADGAHLISRGSATAGSPTQLAARSFRYTATAAAYPSGAMESSYGVFTPYNSITSAWPSGENMSWVCWGCFPDMRPLPHLVGFVTADVASGATFTATPVGSSARTFLTLPTANTQYPTPGTTAWSLAMLWE